MKYIILVEGQSIPMPEEIAADDGKLKAALAPYFPGVSNSTIKRDAAVKDEATGEESITVTVIKQAGTKGAPEAPAGSKREHIKKSPIHITITVTEGEFHFSDVYRIYRDIQSGDGHWSAAQEKEYKDYLKAGGFDVT